ncbi:DUF4142 domain-containing protein [Hymenobacter busanensis]|uniref:DUF4142 domain-containing protein n=1 Tax=Hymenobacter busanensis TaxID=2607656 RepID=A0A7L4ZZ55_9BACT|nr:DUF4142 domain-containing protein [Hymenobacter busanensis]KAA9331375.1 DUF4142 domain-containing protein [Hymenobacter busanensis]QHJ08528.1 DUF4142 domain-containing protein [Hymenobacter busanensis]
MKKVFLPAVLAAALLVGTTSCTDNKGDKPDVTATEGNNADDNYMGNATNGETNAMNDGDSTGAAAGADMAAKADPNATAPHKDDPEFMMSAAHSDQNEIQLSKMALDKGVSGTAKEHANMMIKDHTKSTADLKAIAAKKNVTLPTDMDAEHKAIAEQMKALSGKEFEQRYLQQMVMDHQKTLNTLNAHNSMTQDPDVKGFIGKVTPVVQGHLDMSKKHADMKM